MAIPFNEIEPGFRVIREAFVDDAEPLLDQERSGPVVALLVAIGHEELSRLRLGRPRGEESFAETLPDEWRPVAPSLYRALRNGLAHGYGTLTITFGNTRIVFGLSRTLEPGPHHLVAGPNRELEADAVVLFNTRKLVADLRDCFDEFEVELRQDGELRDALRGRWANRTWPVGDPKEVEAWGRLLDAPGDYHLIGS